VENYRPGNCIVSDGLMASAPIRLIRTPHQLPRQPVLDLKKTAILHTADLSLPAAASELRCQADASQRAGARRRGRGPRGGPRRNAGFWAAYLHSRTYHPQPRKTFLPSNLCHASEWSCDSTPSYFAYTNHCCCCWLESTCLASRAPSSAAPRPTEGSRC
jgi:hypothetical protein